MQNCRRKDLLGKSAEQLHQCGYHLCSEHFEPNQFNVPTERKRLVWNAIPTLFKVPNPPAKVTPSRPAPKERSSKLFKNCTVSSVDGMLYHTKLLILFNTFYILKLAAVLPLPLPVFFLNCIILTMSNGWSRYDFDKSANTLLHALYSWLSVVSSCPLVSVFALSICT